MADNQEKAADKGGFDGVLVGNFAPDAQLVVLERISRTLEENVHKALEELRVIQQLITKLKDDQFNDERERKWAADKEAQRNRAPH
jgi:hypothetical protein